MRVQFTNWGLASRVGDTAYVNKNLLDYPILLKAILQHEQEHTDGFNLKDISLDINGKHLRPVKKDYYKFMLKNPKSLTVFSPVWRYDNHWVFDPLMIIFWFMISLIITSTVVILT